MNDGYKLHQGDYILDLCDKKGVTGPSTWKGTVLQEAEDEQFDIATLREAQTLVGELQWVTCRSRPDICHATGVLSRAMHRRPKEVCEHARSILTYLKDTADWGINFRRASEHLLGEHEELKFPRGEADVEAYADASFAPAAEAYKSVHGTIVMVAGCPILWSSARQPFITGSTAEAELVAYTEVFQQAEGVATLLEALGLENVRRSLYGDNKSALALCQVDVGAWRTRHLRLRAAGLRAAVGCEVSGWHTHHVKGTELPADGLAKQLMGPAFDSFVNQIAMRENKSKAPAQVKTMAVKQQTHQDDDDWTIMRGALAVLCAAALFASGAESQLVDLVALALMLAGVTWLRKIQKKWDREDEPSLGGSAPKAEETIMRARNEPMVEDAKEKKRSDQTRRKVARAQNEPGRGTHPPDSSPTGSRQGQGGDQKTTARLRAMVKMMQADDGGPPRARPHEPWWHPPFHVPPTGTTDRWQVLENFVVRVHCKMRYQRCHVPTAR